MNRSEARSLATELVSKMTLEEKAGQLTYNAPAIPRLGIPAYNWWNEALHGVARAGTATVFPQAIGMAAMFSDETVEKIASVVSTEARAKYNMNVAHGDRDIYKGLTMWSPNINIFRDPRWGRGHETFGEDPYLTSKSGVAYIRGLQGNGRYLKTSACAKHFAVHSGPEKLRHEFDAVASKKDLHETYLPAFKAAVTEGKVESVMGAYNRVNGEPACGSHTLLVDYLRGQWKFEGHVVSDCWAIRDFHVNHMVTSTAPESAALALSNGCDLNCGNTYLHMLQAYKDGLVTEKQIETACIRLFTTRYMLGMFDDDCEYNKIRYTECDTDESNRLACEIAEKSMVLLENDGVLPLDPDNIGTIAVIGPNADSIPVLEGNYNGTSSRYVTFLEGIRTVCTQKGIRLLYSQGCHLYKDRTSGLCMEDDRLAEAVACAEQADVVIACVGLDPTLEGEEGDTGNEYSSGDKATLNLPLSQQKLLESLSKATNRLITVIAAGSSVNADKGNAKILTWYPGQAGGTALSNIIFGKVSPSGRLPLTFYKDVSQLPEFTDYSMKERTYRYFSGKALYPFGHGLSYTSFTICGAEKHGNQIDATVENTGSTDSETVIQIYVAPENVNATPNPRLCGYKRIALKAGERLTFTVDIDSHALDVYDDEGNTVTADHAVFHVGMSQPDAFSVALCGVTPCTVVC